MIIRFDARIYKRKALLSAADAFKDFARVSIKSNAGEYTAQIDVVEGALQDIRREFCNYVLGMTHKCR